MVISLWCENHITFNPESPWRTKHKLPSKHPSSITVGRPNRIQENGGEVIQVYFCLALQMCKLFGKSQTILCRKGGLEGLVSTCFVHSFSLSVSSSRLYVTEKSINWVFPSSKLLVLYLFISMYYFFFLFSRNSYRAQELKDWRKEKRRSLQYTLRCKTWVKVPFWGAACAGGRYWAILQVSVTKRRSWCTYAYTYKVLLLIRYC